MNRIVKFTVDAKLLRELGERLVGRPHIALAELVKNAYDADASKVTIRLHHDTIEVIDDGHGMDEQEFVDYWMRIGTTHKERQAYSRVLRRPLTGSKGVGRLAVQLLASRLELHSRSMSASYDLSVDVDWTEAVEAGALTEAEAELATVPKCQIWDHDTAQGTRLVLRNLNHAWNRKQIIDLAQEIWPLQPPFQTPSRSRQDFQVVLDSPDPEIVQTFARQMSAVLRLWTARLQVRMVADQADDPNVLPVVRPASVYAQASDSEAGDGESAMDLLPPPPSDNPGRPCTFRLALEFPGEAPTVVRYRLEDCRLEEVDFEIRIFTLQRRQPYGISVGQARRYLNTFGGVHIYDAGFHLPYYGTQSDWLGIEQDHSHRLSASKLLPEGLQSGAGMRYLPTNSRIFGVVNVDTAAEARQSRNVSAYAERDRLRIQVTRDRLASTPAYDDLVLVVRWALDYYAFREAARAYKEARKTADTEPPPSRQVEDLLDALDHYSDVIPSKAREDLEDRVRSTYESVRAESEQTAAQTALLGTLATAGINALAYEHEVGKQFDLLRRARHRLQRIADDESLPDRIRGEIADVDRELGQWIERALGTRDLFNPLLDPGNRAARGRFRARQLVAQVSGQVKGLARGATIACDGVDADLRLPEGGFPEWSALFQNLIVNGLNATLDQPIRLIEISSRSGSNTRTVLVQDTGTGIDLSTAEGLFEPFARRQTVSRERAGLALGGTGLGLTIVRMLAGQLGCSVRFVEPDDGYATAAAVSWKELE